MRFTAIIRDSDAYDRARRALLRLPTPSQSQNNQRIQNIIKDPIDTTNVTLADLNEEPSSKTMIVQNRFPSRLILHYHHERRLCTYKRDLHEIWSRNMNPTPLSTIKLIVGHRNHSNLKRELIHKKPRLLSIRNNESRRP